ncbi:MAG: exodeoxyribonuclease VII large subunit [SAR202 cluster bacterium]|nr:exodeoxyribonuclease VII large subunit [SAR202 cluster bacterium]
MAIYSVSQLTSYLKEQLERDALLQDIWVAGEVANLARPGSGHSYFSLRDAKGSFRCVMFRNSVGTERLENGGAVVVHGRVSIYEVRGELQLVADIVQLEGVGELQLKFEELNLKLRNEGLFEPSRKRPLRTFPERIGVVTSPTGAVWQDIQMVVARRYPLVELLLAPTAVQGNAAAPGIVEAFGELNGLPDVDAVILARGGGSLEDLWPFNEEPVARAVYSSRAPVICGVGHETDVTIADLVADVRAPTPSAAAEIAVPDRADLATRLLVADQALAAGVWAHIGMKSDAMERLEDRVRRGRPDLDAKRLHIDDQLQRAATRLTHALEVSTQRSEGLRLRLEALSPAETLRRGYAIVQRRRDGVVVSEAAQVGVGESLDVALGSGSLETEVTSVTPGNSGGDESGEGN